MITLILGVPRSGKSYFAVNFIYEEIKKEKSKYKYIYTNLNLNYEKCEKYKKDFVKPLILDEFLMEVHKEYEYSHLYKDNKLYDEETGELIKDFDSYMKKLGIFKKYKNSLIIIDEAHLYFTDKTEPHLLRFLSYHGHYDIDMFIITQNKSLINRKYLAFVELTYFAQASSKRLIGNVFVYKIYSSYQTTKNNYAGKEKITFSKKVADCYNSGSTRKYKSLSSKLIIPALIGILVVFFVFHLFQNYVKCKHFFSCPIENKSNQVTKPGHKKIKKNYSLNNKNKKNNYKNNDVINDLTDYKYSYNANCFKVKCIINNQYILPRPVLDFILSKSYVFSKIHYITNDSIYFKSNVDIAQFFQGGNNEENSTTFSNSVF
ncbi:zona occludens toxin [Lebetimonas natsushimae]|uniref:Zona occludens toxin n=1 Tax=Lebetimonas natsushimae TaxID=1936991 RepID=A0A292YD59_9BACT|nr:zonular occludens toxin domain-containing protein [Lebetimonas natsushimae]GAX87353.1 zona occludens toxin [Lebetimonas natsushimae]